MLEPTRTRAARERQSEESGNRLPTSAKNGKMKSRGRYQESRLRSGAQWRGHINKPNDEPLRTSMETRRLILRPFESDDAEAALVSFGDSIVMRFTPAGPATSIEPTTAR